MTKNHNYIVVGFSYRVCTHTVGVNDFFSPRRTIISLPRPNYGIGNKNYNIEY